MTRQGTVWAFDERTTTGNIVTDDGAELTFGAEVFLASGLRLLRPGQRVRMAATGDVITALTIVTLDAPR